MQLHADLALFPAESRATTAPYLFALQRTMAGPTKSTKELRTVRSHRLHYLCFAYDMKWTDDLSCATLSRHRVSLQLASYALHLSSGNSLLCRTLKSSTIKGYVRDVATFLRQCDPQQRDFRRNHDSDKHFSAPLVKVYAEIECWEKVPNRREPFTVEMLQEL